MHFYLESLDRELTSKCIAPQKKLVTQLFWGGQCFIPLGASGWLPAGARAVGLRLLVVEDAVDVEGVLGLEPCYREGLGDVAVGFEVGEQVAVGVEGGVVVAVTVGDHPSLLEESHHVGPIAQCALVVVAVGQLGAVHIQPDAAVLHLERVLELPSLVDEVTLERAAQGVELLVGAGLLLVAKSGEVLSLESEEVVSGGMGLEDAHLEAVARAEGGFLAYRLDRQRRHLVLLDGDLRLANEFGVVFAAVVALIFVCGLVVLHHAVEGVVGVDNQLALLVVAEGRFGIIGGERALRAEQ